MLIVALVLASLPSAALGERWISNVYEPRSFTIEGLALSGSKIFVATGSGYTEFDLLTGKRGWTVTEQNQIGIDVAADDAGLFVTLDNGEILSVNPRNGARIWGVRRKGFSSDLALDEGTVYGQLAHGTLSALNRKTGTPRWTIPVPTEPRNENPAIVEPLIASGDSLFFATRGRRLLRVRKTDGKVLWSQPVGEWSTMAVGPQRVFVRDGARLWSLDRRNGTPGWRRDLSVLGGGGLLSAFGPDMVLSGKDGHLRRFDGKTGRLVGDVPLSVGYERHIGQPFQYRDTWWIVGNSTLFRLRSNLQPVETFDLGIRVSGYGIRSAPTKEGMLLWDYDAMRLVGEGRATSLPSSSLARRALAERIAQKAKWQPQDMRTLRQLRDDATPALAARLNKRYDESALRVLLDVASPAQTDTVANIWRSLSTRKEMPGDFRALQALADWLMSHGEDAPRVAAALEVYSKSAKESGQRMLALALLGHSPDSRAVEIMLRTLRDESKEAADARELAYWHAAASGNPEVLAELRRMRDATRKLPTALKSSLSAGDADGDGLDNREDRNPYAAPRDLTDEEQVLATAFEGRFHFDSRSERAGGVSFPPGIRPIELFGWRGQVLLEGKFPREKGISRKYPIPFLRFGTASMNPDGTARAMDQGGPTVLFNKDRTQASVQVAVTFGGLDGTGYSMRLRKMDGVWYVVSGTMSWIS